MTFAKFQFFSDTVARDVGNQARKIGFIDGRVSARGRAKDVKKNRQMSYEKDAWELLKAVEHQLFDSAFVHVFAFPKKISGMMVNLYGEGETYGWHVDNSIHNDGVNKSRRDLSFTISLNDPATYDGGHLEFYRGEELVSIKLGIGEMIIYPTGQLHRVTPVTRGERLSCVGWMTSWIQDVEIRQSLTRLKTLGIEYTKLEKFPEGLLLRHDEVFHNFFRKFAN